MCDLGFMSNVGFEAMSHLQGEHLHPQLCSADGSQLRVSWCDYKTRLDSPLNLCDLCVLIREAEVHMGGMGCRGGDCELKVQCLFGCGVTCLIGA